MVSFAARYPRLAARERGRRAVGGGAGGGAGPGAAAAGSAGAGVGTGVGARVGAVPEAGPGVRRAMRVGLEDLRGEVQQLAEQALRAKERQRLQVSREEALGVRRKKGPRMPRNISLGIHKARVKKAEKDKEAMRLAGMLDTGKKPKKRKAKPYNPNEGVTVVKPPVGRGGRGRR